MSPNPPPPVPLQGLHYFSALSSLLARLHSHGVARDKAKNRSLFFDQFAALLIFYFFNPSLKSLRALQEASELKSVQDITGCQRFSTSSFSEASRVFDPELLSPIMNELGMLVPPPTLTKEEKLLHNLVATDGSLFPAIPKMVWALGVKGNKVKLHLQFEVLRGIPIDASVTKGTGSETAQFGRRLEKGRLYVGDRGYASGPLMKKIIEAKSSFIIRIREDSAFQEQRRRELTEEDKKAGVERDIEISKLGTEHHKDFIKKPIRLVEVKTNKKDKEGHPVVLLLATDRMDLSAELIALGYKYRWKVELFFRWFKCVFGCRHLLFQSPEGVLHQMYAAIIGTLIVSLWTGTKANVRTYEMFCHYLSGWASEEELQSHIEKLSKPKRKKTRPHIPILGSWEG